MKSKVVCSVLILRTWIRHEEYAMNSEAEDFGSQKLNFSLGIVLSLHLDGVWKQHLHPYKPKVKARTKVSGASGGP